MATTREAARSSAAKTQANQSRAAQRVTPQRATAQRDTAQRATAQRATVNAAAPKAAAAEAAAPHTIAARPRKASERVSRAAREAEFLRSVDRQNTANLVTGDLSYYTGSHVDYTCDVDTIVRPGVILGQCGSEAEPIDLFVRLPTAHLRVGDRLRVLGILEAPASWADVMGHTVYYAFLRAVFVDHEMTK